MRGSDDAPASTASRSDHSPAQKIAAAAVDAPGTVADPDPAGRRFGALDPATDVDAAAGRGDVLGQRPGDGGEVDDAGRRRVQGGEPAGVRLDFGDLLGRQPPQARHSVGGAAPLQLRRADPARPRRPRRSACRCGRSRALAAGSTRRAAEPPRRRASPSASRARSRCRRGRRRWSGRSGGRRAGPRPRERRGWRSAFAAAAPAPPPARRCRRRRRPGRTREAAGLRLRSRAQTRRKRWTCRRSPTRPAAGSPASPSIGPSAATASPTRCRARSPPRSNAPTSTPRSA